MSEDKTKAVKALQGVKGMNDMLPTDAPLWDMFESAARSIQARADDRRSL